MAYRMEKYYESVPKEISNMKILGMLFLAKNLHYRYKVGDKWYYSEIDLDHIWKDVYLSSEWLPLQLGDQFMVYFSKNNPVRHQVLFDMPTDRQYQKYKELSLDICNQSMVWKVNEGQELKSKYCNCLLKILDEEVGLSGFGHVIFHQVESDNNSRYNMSTFQNLLKKEGLMTQNRRLRWKLDWS